MGLKSRRSNVKSYKDYTSYKRYLREDFEYSCVYCTVHENEFGGHRHFHVDHHRPKDGPNGRPDLETDYSNLLYSCGVCNSYKGCDWPSDNPIEDGVGYLDPCEHDYDEHMLVDDSCWICSITSVGRYMIDRLHLDRLQLRRLRETRKQAADQHVRFMQVSDDLIEQTRVCLEDCKLPDHAREILQRYHDFYVLERQQYLEEWSKRHEPAPLNYYR